MDTIPEFIADMYVSHIRAQRARKAPMPYKSHATIKKAYKQLEESERHLNQAMKALGEHAALIPAQPFYRASANIQDMRLTLKEVLQIIEDNKDRH